MILKVKLTEDEISIKVEESKNSQNQQVVKSTSRKRRNIYEQKYGKQSIVVEAVDSCMNEAYVKALKEFKGEKTGWL